MKRLSVITSLLLAFAAPMALADEGTKHEFDKKTFDKIAKKTIGAIIKGQVNPTKMMEDLEKLTDLGVAGCKEHMGEPETPDHEKKLMQMTADAGQKDKSGKRKMTALTLEKIEQQWHEGGAAKQAGIDIESFGHFSEVMCHYDAVVHPATCIICLKEYQKTTDNSRREVLLSQMKAELQEVREHLKHLD